MIAKLLDYLKDLCVQHVEFKHTADNQAYFEFDYQYMTEARSRNQYVLFVNTLQGKNNDNRGDHKTDQVYLTALFLVKVESKNIKKSRDYILKCKGHMDEFISKMAYDKKNGNADLCALLKLVDIYQATWEHAELTADLWTGVQMRLPFRYHLADAYVENRWGAKKTAQTPPTPELVP